jgi:hypothetical protein
MAADYDLKSIKVEVVWDMAVSSSHDKARENGYENAEDHEGDSWSIKDASDGRGGDFEEVRRR